jgi:hypothetical protein
MKISILWAAILALGACQSRADIINNGLFQHYAVSASDVAGSGYIRFYGPTNDDYNAIFTGWAITGSSADYLAPENNYPAYDSIEALDLEDVAGASEQTRPAFSAAVGDAYTLLLSYVENPVCIGDANNPVCGDPGVDIKPTVSSNYSSGNNSHSP